MTTKGDPLYAIALGWPADGKLTTRTLAAGCVVWPKQAGAIETMSARAAAIPEGIRLPRE